MPIYAYRCRECGFEKDYLRKVSDPVLTDCPSCGKPTLAKQVTAAGFQLKGSGWYKTDFRGGSSPAAKDAKGDSTPGASTDSASSAKAESTPAASCPGGSCACH